MAEDERSEQISKPLYKEEKSVKPFGGFWIRFLAFMIDLGIVFILLSTLGALALDALIPLGKATLLFGILVYFLYFTIGNSAIGRGKTLGKALTGLTTLSYDGSFLTPKEAFSRTVLQLVCLQSAVFPLCILFHLFFYQPEFIPLSRTSLIGLFFRGAYIHSVFQYYFVRFIGILLNSLLIANILHVVTSPAKQSFYDLILKHVIVKDPCVPQDQELLHGEHEAILKARSFSFKASIVTFIVILVIQSVQEGVLVSSEKVRTSIEERIERESDYQLEGYTYQFSPPPLLSYPEEQREEILGKAATEGTTKTLQTLRIPLHNIFTLVYTKSGKADVQMLEEDSFQEALAEGAIRSITLYYADSFYFLRSLITEPIKVRFSFQEAVDLFIVSKGRKVVGFEREIEGSASQDEEERRAQNPSFD